MRVFGRTRLALSALCLAAGACGVPALAAVVEPASDDEVIEVLPAAVGSRAEERRLRQQLAQNPRSEQVAVLLARRYLERARSDGDPRYAGQALAALRAWADPIEAPDQVLLLQATVQQFVHEFEPAAANLERLVNRQPGLAQAWLTLATVRRVQGRYALSDQACEGLAKTGESLYAAACRAENDSLQGRHGRARETLAAQSIHHRNSRAVQNWLLTTSAENEVRAGAPGEAEKQYRRALSASQDPYTALSFADFLLHRRQWTQVLEVLAAQPRSDAVLLRRAIAGVQSGSAQGSLDAKEMRERMLLAGQRPQARVAHARERAMFALWIDKSPREALELARENVRHQREPLDLLVLVEAALASRDADAVRAAGELARSMGLRDKRIDALL